MLDLIASDIGIISDLISDLIDIRYDTGSNIEAGIVADIGCIG